MKNSTIKKILDLPFYTEGPCMDGEGSFYFTTLTADFIGKIDRKGIYSIWSKGGCSNGQVFLQGAGGAHWCCDSRAPGIAQYDAEGIFSGYLVHKECAGSAVMSPNDLVLDVQSNLYFSDSIRRNGKVFFKGKEGVERVVVDGIDYANGLVLSMDEKKMYVAESYRNRILVLELSEPGIAKGKAEVFADLPCHTSGGIINNLPDGLALDREGNLWVAHYGMQAIQVLSPRGKLLFTVDTTLPLTSNLYFITESPIRKTLLVTGGYGEPGPGAVLMITIDL